MSACTQVAARKRKGEGLEGGGWEGGMEGGMKGGGNRGAERGKKERR